MWCHRPSLPRFLFSWIFVFGQKGHFTLLLLDWKRVSPRESVWPTLSLPSFSFLPPPPHNHSGLSSGRYFYVSQCQQEGLFDFLAFRRDGIITKVGQSDFWTCPFFFPMRISDYFEKQNLNFCTCIIRMFAHCTQSECLQAIQIGMDISNQCWFDNGWNTGNSIVKSSQVMIAKFCHSDPKVVLRITQSFIKVAFKLF